MADLLVVPLKKPSDVDVVKPLKNLIQSSYSGSGATEPPADYSEAVNDFSKLRNVAIWKVFDKQEASLEMIYSYYDQLCNLEAKIPAHELQVPFKWKDAFDKGSLFYARMSLTLASLSYEKVCVLFNIAALQCAVAASQSTESDEGLKLATKLFQQSAGIFTHLKAIVPSHVAHEPTPDLGSETLTVLANLMIAQAQELFVIKAIKDNMKEAIIAKLACQCEDFYAEVQRGAQKDSVRSLWDKDWISTIAGKQAGFHAMSQFYQSLQCKNTKRVGEEISRLQQAVELFKAAQSRSGKSYLFEEYANKAQRNLTEAKKDNNLIYNEIIPDVNTLDLPGKAQLAKIMPLSGRLGQSQKDLFGALVPVALHQALTACETRKTEFVNVEIMKLREATQTLNGVLSSLNLPAAIEVTASGCLPPSLLEKGNSIKEKGGVSNIQSLITELPELLNRNKEILDETERLLNEERNSDNQLRDQFKARWTRTPSDKLTESFRTNVSKYREIINKAVEADTVIRGKFEKNIRGMEILSKNPDEIEAAIPSSGGGASISNCSTTHQLRTLMENVETIKTERDVIESELKSATIDMKDQFLQALAQDGAINEPALSVSHIGQTLGPLQQQVRDSIAGQESLIAKVQETHREFSIETGSGSGSRDAFLSELASAFDNFIELQMNLNEASKFYNDLTQLLVGFQNKIADYCFARKAEKEELLKDLTQESIRQQPQVIPSVPISHGGNDPSVRPPPTTTSAASVSIGANIPYPTQIQGMPVPYGASSVAPYPTYIPPPMPQSFNPYATLPYPNTAYNYQNFPQVPQQHYGTYPGNYAHQQHQQPQQPQQPPPQGYPHPQQPTYPW